MKTASSPPFRSIPVNPTLRLFAYQCRRLYFRTMYRMIPSSRSTFGVIPISAMRIQIMVCILPPFIWRIPKVLYMHTMNLLHIYIRMAYVKFLKEINFFIIYDKLCLMESKKCLLYGPYGPFLYCVYAKRLIQMLLINTIMLHSSDFEFN